MRRPTEFPEFPSPENSPGSLEDSGGGPKSAWNLEVSPGIFGKFLPPKKSGSSVSFPSLSHSRSQRRNLGRVGFFPDFSRIYPKFILDLSWISSQFIPDSFWIYSKFFTGVLLDFFPIYPELSICPKC